MKRFVLCIVAALTVAVTGAAGVWVYEGQWCSGGTGNGQFDRLEDVAIATNGNVYVADAYNHRVQSSASGERRARARGSSALPGVWRLPRAATAT